MSYIYEPKGKAAEYGEYALNLYNGCPHGCTYCYVPPIVYRQREDFHTNIKPRNIDMRILEREITGHAGKNLFLSFTSDPYQPLEKLWNLTGRVIDMCHDNYVRVIILTKAGKLSERDFKRLALNPILSNYGATLTFLNLQDSLRHEPGAAPPEERLRVLKKAHNMGIPTWASLEPVIDPEQSLEIIRRTKGYVDEFKVGKWNHDKAADTIDWPLFARQAVALLEELGKKYYIKKDLAVYL
jgi:DNA repair photolyase